jgi:hypothetical protein
LRALQDIAVSNNTKVVVPYEATSLMGAAEVLLSSLRNAPQDDGTTGELSANSNNGPVAKPTT